MIFLSVDFGTSAVKAALVDDEKGILCHASEGYPYILLPCMGKILRRKIP